MMIVIVVHLAASHPTMRLERRFHGFFIPRAALFQGRNPGPFAPGEFDRHHRILTGLSGGRELAPPPRLASAYAAGDLPPWRLHDRYLACAWPERFRTDNLDHRIDQALTVAALLDPPARPSTH